MATEIDLRLFRGQIAPRLKSIILSVNSFCSFALAVIVSFIAPHVPGGQLPISSLVNIGFTYASLATGVCVSALILTFALPGETRLRRWAKLEGETEGKSALSELIFVCAWSALAQLGVLATCILATLFGGDIPVAPSGATALHQIGLASGLTSFFYASGQLIVVIQTLVQVGVVVIAEESGPPAHPAPPGILVRLSRKLMQKQAE
jgi:hypothetical protein